MEFNSFRNKKIQLEKIQKIIEGFLFEELLVSYKQSSPQFD